MAEQLKDYKIDALYFSNITSKKYSTNNFKKNHSVLLNEDGRLKRSEFWSF